MLSLAVHQDIKGMTGIKNIPISSILYISSRDRDRVAVHTSDNTYYMIGTLIYWENVLNNSGYHFLNVDRSNTINVDNVVCVNEIFKDAYFEHNKTKASKKCPIASHRYEAIVRELKVLKQDIVII
ncbi:LytTR family transcriptional regulator DNA-binding domain-containing protein [Paenibacillus medicaginis]|uniref:LytTR family transcriptional regulator DNA-binding domain-containing protein n=1 Tax=Paenibacillus medicaginis TaxID=1470560 RepID=A0ABV5C0N1_9BACL